MVLCVCLSLCLCGVEMCVLVFQSIYCGMEQGCVYPIGVYVVFNLCGIACAWLSLCLCAEQTHCGIFNGMVGMVEVEVEAELGKNGEAM